MTQTLLVSGGVKNEAASQAEGNFLANRAAVAGVQRELGELLEGGVGSVEFLYGRDGALTAILPGVRWWGNCSLPRRAAEFMFESLEIRGVVGCFLFPVHAAQVRAALDRLEPQQAVVALVPDRQTLRIILHCEDFSKDIASHRLWFAAGEDWEAGLKRLLMENPGLPTPGEFIRAISVDSSAADALIAPAQKIFADETNRRAGEIQKLKEQRRQERAVQQLCVIAPSQFRLWNDAPVTLAGVLEGAGGVEVKLFDSDDPASASPLALARAACGADSVVTANLGRGDLPPVISGETPVVTWVTLARIPAFEGAGPRDSLIVADPAWANRARAMGWPEGRVCVGTWPVVEVSRGANDEAGASLIADTLPLVPPKSVNEFSSHLLLWDLIAAELGRDPSLLREGIDAYLAPRLRRLQIDEAAFDKAVFIERLIVPAYQQSIARALLAKNVPVRFFGKGWEEIEEFAALASGAVESREQFRGVLARSGALVHVWPSGDVHPVEATTLPVIRPRHLTERARLDTVPALSAAVVMSALS